jgi:hypothetical protein
MSFEQEVRKTVRDAILSEGSIDDDMGTIAMISEWIAKGLISHGDFILVEIKRPVFSFKSFTEMLFTADVILDFPDSGATGVRKKYTWTLKGNQYKGRIASELVKIARILEGKYPDSAPTEVDRKLWRERAEERRRKDGIRPRKAAADTNETLCRFCDHPKRSHKGGRGSCVGRFRPLVPML